MDITANDVLWSVITAIIMIAVPIVAYYGSSPEKRKDSEMRSTIFWMIAIGVVLIILMLTTSFDPTSLSR